MAREIIGFPLHLWSSDKKGSWFVLGRWKRSSFDKRTRKFLPKGKRYHIAIFIEDVPTQIEDS